MQPSLKWQVMVIRGVTDGFDPYNGTLRHEAIVKHQKDLAEWNKLPDR